MVIIGRAHVLLAIVIGLVVRQNQERIRVQEIISPQVLANVRFWSPTVSPSSIPTCRDLVTRHPSVLSSSLPCNQTITMQNGKDHYRQNNGQYQGHPSVQHGPLTQQSSQPHEHEKAQQEQPRFQQITGVPGPMDRPRRPSTSL
jgi:hypothetical protein